MISLLLTLVLCLLLPSEALAIDDAAFDVVKSIIPKFTATATTGIKWGSVFGGTVLFAVGLSKHSMKVAGYGLGLATVPISVLALVAPGAALLLD